MIGDIMSVSRLRMGTDGKGMTTLVTFFDCPLHCKYCINDFCHEDRSKFIGTPRGEYTPKQLIKVLEKDDIYYKMTGGGVTFGGGEPLLQSAFIHEVCQLADPLWKMRIETSLNAPWRNVEPVLKDMDEWIIDVKDMDHMIYEKYTGSPIDNLIDNLFRIERILDKSKIHIRIPRIPNFNNEALVNKSVDRIRDILGVEPEVFDYIKPAEINYSRWNDDVL